MAKIQDRLYNRIIEGKLLELSNEEIAELGLAKASDLPALSDAINLGQIAVIQDDVEETLYHAYFSKEITEAEYNAIKSDGLVILMFNTSCVIFPFAKAQDNRFCVNAIYNADGESMVVRAKLSFSAETGYFITVTFDSAYAEHLADASSLRPYGIMKFLSI